MKKKLLIELIIYVVLVVVGIILLFTYEPKEKEIIIPQDFRLGMERGVSNAALYF
ncbi:hypothetical protein [Tepidibacter hydrothermalis]|uniref:Uncharacterized protein n=1 Tax=Tepidibacter hydrothermalis TaxID=3036126 RepID=A0ABY8EH94_9FIRM|nr:hypothetical protein [Tepidibacter hydrothermalis]WFD10872.1 hypothetical protein P4S50_02010 [Tepidibacter hydrothermalis]